MYNVTLLAFQQEKCCSTQHETASNQVWKLAMFVLNRPHLFYLAHYGACNSFYLDLCQPCKLDKASWYSAPQAWLQGMTFFWIVLYISDGDRFVHFFVLRLFYHSNLDSYNEELMIVHSVLFMGDASIQYSLLITKSLIHLGIEPGPLDQKSSALPM